MNGTVENRSVTHYQIIHTKIMPAIIKTRGMVGVLTMPLVF